jgi:hypothetical protein
MLMLSCSPQYGPQAPNLGHIIEMKMGLYKEECKAVSPLRRMSRK